MRTRCQAGRREPTPTANAAADATLSNVSAAAIAANDAMVSGFAAVIAKNRV